MKHLRVLLFFCSTFVSSLIVVCHGLLLPHKRAESGVLRSHSRREQGGYDPFLGHECRVGAGEAVEGCGRGHEALTEAECHSRGCCWRPGLDAGQAGQCYLARRMLREECLVPYKEKDDCGYYGITEGECLIRGCCYRPPSHLPNDPACFKQKYQSVRLVGSELSGRLEVQHNQEWGTVCDDSFTKAAADVVCRSLGHLHGGTLLSQGSFESGSGMIWLDEVQCRGDEETLEECQHDAWGSNDCGHSEDVGVRCFAEGEEMVEEEWVYRLK